MASRINRFVIRGAIVGALGGLLFGFDTAVISGTTSALTSVFRLSPRALGFTVAVALIGTVFGSITAGPLESRFGARGMLRVMALLYVISALGSAFAPTWTMLLLARFVGGIGIGGSSVLSPIYIAEISPARLRGRLVGLFQINIVLGILLAYFSNYMIARADFGAVEWRWEFGVAMIPAAFFLAMLFSIPKSARWLAARNRSQEALASLRLLGVDEPELELERITSAIQRDAVGSRETLFQRKYRKPILLAISIAVLNQLTGVNAILYYLNDIFVSAGFSQLSGNLQAVAYGGVSFIATMIGMSLIDRLGRKTLLLVGSVGMIFSLSGVATVFSLGSHREWLLPFLIIYSFFFSISQGCVIWVYLSEIFPTRVRGKGQSLGCTANWLTNTIISFGFPVIVAVSGALPFVFFACMMVVQLVLVGVYFPETKNVSLEKMQELLGVEAAPIRKLEQKL